MATFWERAAHSVNRLFLNKQQKTKLNKNEADVRGFAPDSNYVSTVFIMNFINTYE